MRQFVRYQLAMSIPNADAVYETTSNDDMEQFAKDWGLSSYGVTEDGRLIFEGTIIDDTAKVVKARLTLFKNVLKNYFKGKKVDDMMLAYGDKLG